MKRTFGPFSRPVNSRLVVSGSIGAESLVLNRPNGPIKRRENETGPETRVVSGVVSGKSARRSVEWRGANKLRRAVVFGRNGGETGASHGG